MMFKKYPSENTGKADDFKKFKATEKSAQKSNLEREYDIPVKSVENIEVKEEPSAEKVYSDLNLPEIINDVRLLRQEINGARRSFKVFRSS